MLCSWQQLIQKSGVTCLLMLLSSHVYAAPQTVELQLSESVSINSVYIQLADLCSNGGTALPLQKSIADIRIARAPRIGYVQTYSRADIEKIISRQVHTNKVNIHWRGADEVRVTTRSRQYDYSQIESYAKKSFMDKMDEYGFTTVIEQVTHNEVIELPDARIEFKSRISSDFIGQRNCVWVDVFVNDEFYRAIPVWINSIVKGGVLVAERYLDAKTEVTSRDFVFEDYLIIGNPDHYASMASLTDSSLLVTSLHKGEALLANHIKPMPDVIGGKIVSVDITQGNVSIKLQGVARQDGALGEVLRIQLLHNNETVMAKVVGKQQVSVI